MTFVIRGRMSLKQHKATLRELTKDGRHLNPHNYGTVAGVSVILQGGMGNGYRKDLPWYVVGELGTPGDSLHKHTLFGLKEMPPNYAPFAVNGLRCWVPVPPDEAKRPCKETVRRGDRWTTLHPCDMAADGDDGLCKSHRTIAAKNTAKKQAFRDERDRSNSGQQIAQDAVDRLAAFGVKGKVHYHVPFGSGMGKYTGDVEVHAEDVLALLREVQELRELKGDM